MEDLFNKNLPYDHDDNELIFKDDNGVFWEKERSESRVWWKDMPDRIGEFVFSFDMKTEFNLFAEYPWKLTPEQKKIFDEDEPHWAKFFDDREYNVNQEQ